MSFTSRVITINAVAVSSTVISVILLSNGANTGVMTLAGCAVLLFSSLAGCCSVPPNWRCRVLRAPWKKQPRETSPAAWRKMAPATWPVWVKPSTR